MGLFHHFKNIFDGVDLGYFIKSVNLIDIQRNNNIEILSKH